MTEDLSPKNSIDLAAAEAKAAEQGGRRFWQSLEELSDTKEFRNFLENEFPANAQAEKDSDGPNRRDVLKWMAASAAMAGLGACTKLPTEKIVPYVRPPEEIIPGKPLFYATSMPLGGVATGVLVESHMGRPTKIEGNPEHPGSRGGTDVFTQASILGLYDPDRSQTVVFEGRLSSWADFTAAMGNARTSLAGKGSGMRILTKTVTSPTLGAQIRGLLLKYPEAKWHQYEVSGGDSAREGMRLAFGKPMNPVYRFNQADVVVSLASDFLTSGPGHVRYARDFSSRRDLGAGPSSKLNRLYVVESMPTSTGAMADHRLPLRASEVEDFARKLAAAVGVSLPASPHAVAARVPADWISALGRDLGAHRGSSVIIAGEEQPAFVHALAHAMNAALGNAGKTVLYTEVLEANAVNQLDSLRELASDLNAGQVDFLVILGGNPVYDAPADLSFGSAFLKAKLRVHSGLYNDETGELCHWHAPAAHYLESWGDARAFDGTVGIIQPLIAPLYEGRSAHEIISLVAGDGKSGFDAVRDYWRAERPEKDKAFEAFWETSLHDGVMAGTALPSISVPLRSDFAKLAGAPAAADADALELVFRPDPAIADGEFSNNAWLQEVPRPITRLTWDNAAMLSPATAQQLGLTSGDYVRLKLEGREAKAGVFIVPGHVDNSVTVHLGYGRSRAGKVGTGPGFNAYLLRTSSSRWIARGLSIEKLGKKYAFASVQHQYSIDFEGHPADDESENAFRRDLVQIATLEEFRSNPGFAKNPADEATKGLTIYPGFKYEGNSWGMSIDLNRCVGCNACVVACQSENNIAVVGKDQVARGRSMHWIRIDTYFRGGLGNPEIYYQPLPCMQCENAPCEYVCPVGATTHSPEGLNDMTYNRCVGTRYCSNNCPYKVRRFNFYLYSDFETPSLYGMRNPNVTVRSRGVMEKCTYCVQRINAAKIRAEEENNRPIRDGEILTACQQACPAEAIVFGNINDPTSRVRKLKEQSRDYGLLEDLNTRPRTTYLARVRNPNPEIHG
ncbi:MAG TPA: TAT-variant-translocated molybdopterin oxidoreductase [Verrucomicrobiae bacterium]|jgi:MoCo/4Fe-4S cofactor protein with predicted Tat translocation signal|nr:TAT-variant-translocated molybdopterin oxidoreductase [Verrucomicrobiae bacterium]